MRSWEHTGKPIILAHRGGADEHPENSIEAFQAMVDKGFTYIETDTHATADGELVLMHDPLLDRTTNGSGLITMKTWEDISTLRDESGRRPMLLREALENFPTVDFNIDIKADSATEPIIRLLSSGKYNDRVLIASFSEKRLRTIRAALPGISTSIGTSAVVNLVLASRAKNSLRKSLLARVSGPDRGATCVQIPETYFGKKVLDERVVETAHIIGLAVHVWTINEAMDMARLLRLGIDGLITDRPSLAREVIDIYEQARGSQP